MKSNAFLTLSSGLLLAFACTRGSGAPATPPPQPVTAAVGLRLVECGALLVEDFDAPEMNSRIWRRAHRDPDRTTFNQQGGRLELTASGTVAMNGYWGLGGVKAKDVVMVGEMDIRSTGSSPHRLAFHLCGGDGNRSPDHWVEVVMVDLGDKARFSVGAALPVGFDRRQNQSLELPHPPDQGFLCRIELNGVTNLAAMTPCGDLASTGYCLAQPSETYIVYLPDGGETTVDLSAGGGSFEVEWITPIEGAITAASAVSAGGTHRFTAPFQGAAVLLLSKAVKPPADR